MTDEWLTQLTGEGTPLALAPHAVRLLARGHPVSVARLADAAGLPESDVRAVLSAMNRVDWDDDGNLAGLGLTLVPTDHRVVIGNHQMFTWCALDALLLPVLLDTTVQVRSTCPATGTGIAVTVTPTRVQAVAPAEAVVSQVRSVTDVCDIRSQACDHGRFFASVQAAAPWRRDHPSGVVSSVADAFGQDREQMTRIGWITG